MQKTRGGILPAVRAVATLYCNWIAIDIGALGSFSPGWLSSDSTAYIGKVGAIGRIGGTISDSMKLTIGAGVLQTWRGIDSDYQDNYDADSYLAQDLIAGLSLQSNYLISPLYWAFEPGIVWGNVNGEGSIGFSAILTVGFGGTSDD